MATTQVVTCVVGWRNHKLKQITLIVLVVLMKLKHKNKRKNKLSYKLKETPNLVGASSSKQHIGTSKHNKKL